MSSTKPGLHLRMGAHVSLSSKASLQGQVCQDINTVHILPHLCMVDERRCLLDRSRVDGLPLDFAKLHDDGDGAMRTLMWHKDQKPVFALVLAIRAEA